jgi:DNA repair exonuclease SbcCD ATPase subunit
MNSIENLESRFFSSYQKIERKIGERDRIKKEIDEKLKELNDIDNKRRVYNEAKRILEIAYEKLRVSTMQGIENLVNRALKTIYSDLTFRIELDEERNRNIAKAVIRKESGDIYFEGDPLETSGGTVSQIISLALRISILEKSINPKFEGPLILDEPLTFLDEGSKRLIGEFLKKVSEILNRQIILITHDRILMEIGDKTFYVKIKDGESKIEEITDLSEIEEI